MFQGGCKGHLQENPRGASKSQGTKAGEERSVSFRGKGPYRR